MIQTTQALIYSAGVSSHRFSAEGCQQTICAATRWWRCSRVWGFVFSLLTGNQALVWFSGQKCIPRIPKSKRPRLLRRNVTLHQYGSTRKKKYEQARLPNGTLRCLLQRAAPSVVPLRPGSVPKITREKHLLLNSVRETVRTARRAILPNSGLGCVSWRFSSRLKFS